MAGIKIHFDGKIGKKPELKGEGDKAYTSFGIATERYVGLEKGDLRDGQQTAYKTTWLNVTAFGRQAQYITDRFSVGDTIVVHDAELEVSNYEKKDRENGQVVDANAIGIRALLKDVSGPFRSSPKSESAPASQAATSQPPAVRQQQARASAAAAAAARPAARQATPPPPPPPAAAPVYDDDIPF